MALRFNGDAISLRNLTAVDSAAPQSLRVVAVQPRMQRELAPSVLEQMQQRSALVQPSAPISSNAPSSPGAAASLGPAPSALTGAQKAAAASGGGGGAKAGGEPAAAPSLSKPSSSVAPLLIGAFLAWKFLR